MMKYSYIILIVLYGFHGYCAEKPQRVVSKLQYSFEKCLELSPPGTPIPGKDVARPVLARSLDIHDKVVQSLLIFCKENPAESKIVNPEIIKLSKSDSRLEKAGNDTP